ncbi:AlpA family transcriptional regulator [Schaalia hyovaginalis]|uniref:helix-turn-helix transcriptional regulator n=1 Tax=Schaalia hyovaginalis TaxID=29316 RepID=UPI0026EC69DB|nr:transcriptional regulator [Schaalia hyovaginalis]MCI7512966.1 transcriptional regulator [Schaalia hyovaginalis]
MSQRYLSVSDFAARVGLAAGTMASYGAKGLLPEPDVLIGLGDRAVRGWTAETIDAWMAARPGRGARTDLRRDQNA